MSDHILDPQRWVDAGLPLDRTSLLALVNILLARTPGEAPLPLGDYEQIALLLNGQACSLLADVKDKYGALPVDSPARHLTAVVIAEAERRLSAPTRGTLHCVQHRARLVGALYERLDRLTAELQSDHLAGASPARLSAGPCPGAAAP
jgi:hypothetical protein